MTTFKIAPRGWQIRGQLQLMGSAKARLPARCPGSPPRKLRVQGKAMQVPRAVRVPCRKVPEASLSWELPKDEEVGAPPASWPSRPS